MYYITTGIKAVKFMNNLLKLDNEGYIVNDFETIVKHCELSLVEFNRLFEPVDETIMKTFLLDHNYHILY